MPRQVECVGYDCDLAILDVKDDQFWRGIPELPLPYALPPTMSEVLAAGFPAGGQDLSMTRAVVNRILVGGPTRELCVQIEPALTSGQLVLSASGQLVGMACAGREQGAQHPGYIIPMPVIHTFLQNAQIATSDSRHRRYLGKSVDCYRVQSLENPELRVQLGLPARPGEGEDGGVLVTRVPLDAASAGKLEENDVLLAIDDHPIATDGTVLLPDTAEPLRVNVRYMVQRAVLGSTLRYTVLRKGSLVTVPVNTAPRRQRLLPPRQPVPTPQWLVLGGLVFVPLLPEYEAIVPKSKLAAIHEPPSEEGEQVVLLLRVLQAEINIGYEDICGMLDSFNGHE